MTSPTQKGEREEALEPCPFCNAAPIPVDDPQGPLGIMAHPSEGDCFLAGREISGRQGRARWNRRASSKAEGEMREALEWALDEIDALANRLVQFGYPQAMWMLAREDQIERYQDARAALSPKDTE